MAETGVALVTLGCKVNRAEAEAIAAELLDGGVRITAQEDAAVVVLTTCTVTGEADRKARKAVHHALRLPGRPVVVVTGCLAAIDPAGLAALGERVIVEADKAAVPARVRTALAARSGEETAATPAVETAPLADTPTVASAAPGVFRTRVAVKVQDGCDAFCAYCIVPFARGVPRAVPLAEVVDRVRALVADGIAEVVLTGINIGRYKDADVRLPDLIEAVAATGVRRIRVSSIEPLDVDARFLAAAARTPAFCPHLHIPLQAGCDATLAAMGRGYDTAAYAATLAAARAALPGLAVTTDVMAGFPGERPEDFAETLAFCETMAFAKLHVFRYSARAGTRAAVMPCQVAPAERAARAARLRALGERLGIAWAASLAGRRVSVLVERVRPDGEGATLAEGTTAEHARALLPGAGLRAGDVVEALLGERMADGSLRATPLNGAGGAC